MSPSIMETNEAELKSSIYGNDDLQRIITALGLPEPE